MIRLIYFIRSAFWVIVSKILYGRNVRVIKGLPRMVVNGEFVFGRSFTAGKDFRLEVIERDARIEFGERVKINDYFHIGAVRSIYIGDDVLIGSRVTVVDHGHGNYSGASCSNPQTPPDDRELLGLPIRIEKNVWLCEGVVVLPGVKIGAGSIIGANSVVVSDIPPGSIAVGAPAKVVKKYSESLKEWIKP